MVSADFRGKTFNGKILRRESEIIYADIYPGWECTTTDSYNITFEVNQLVFQLQHNALNFIRQHHLFDIFINNPQYHSPDPPWIDNNNTISPQDGLNAEQLQAIECIVNGNYNPMPYLLYGPPGRVSVKLLLCFEE